MFHIRGFLNSFLRVKWFAIIVAIGIVVGVGTSTLYRGALGRVQRTDLTVYLKAAEDIKDNHGINLYSVENSRHWHYVYTPLLAVLMSPIARWPLPVNIMLAYLISVCALLGTCFLSHSFGEKSHELDWKIVLSIILCAPTMLETITRGQLGIIMLFFATAIYFCYLKNWKILAGVLLGFAVALKISPLALTIFFFLFKKEWKIAVVSIMTGAFFVFFFPAFAVGFHQNWELLKIWKGLMAVGSSNAVYKSYLFAELFSPFQVNIQSIYAVLTRCFWVSEQSFIGGSNLTIRVVSQLAGIILLGALYLNRLPAKSAENRSFLLAEYSLYPMLMLFSSPISQDHHYTVLYLLFLSALLVIRYYPAKSFHRVLLLVSVWVAAGFVLAGFIFDSIEFVGGPLWGSLFLWLVVLLCVAQYRKTLPK